VLTVKKTTQLKSGLRRQRITKATQEMLDRRRQSCEEKEIGSNEAQHFSLLEHDWFMNTARQVTLKRGLPDSDEDLAHEVYDKLKNVSDEVWSRTLNKRSYVARMIINQANDFCAKNQPLEPITDNILVSTPLEAMEAAILITELYGKLSLAEQKLLELMFEQYSGTEIANKLGIGCATARKRISRLTKKLGLLSEGKLTSRDTTARVNAERGASE
jgi:DNA-directed RNA polymerase specialized sigma24 family protein